MTPRPLQPLLFRQTAALALVLGIAGALWWQSFLLLPLLLWLDSRSHRLGRILLCILLTALGFVWGQFRVSGATAWLEEESFKAEVTGVVMEVGGIPGNRIRVRLSDLKRDGIPLEGDLLWTWEEPLLRPVVGQVVTVGLRIRPSVGIRNNGDDGGYWLRRGIRWRAFSIGDKGVLSFNGDGGFFPRCAEHWRSRVVGLLEGRYPVSGTDLVPPSGFGSPKPARSDGWGMLPALLFGDRSYLSVGQVELLAKAGLAHSIALSGQHLSVAGLFAFLAVFTIGFCRPSYWLRLPRRHMLLLCSLLFAVLYLWIGGAPPSLWRAFLMMLFWAVLLFRKHPAAFPDAMLTALVCMAVVQPAFLEDPGVRLSFCSVAGICLLASTVSDAALLPLSAGIRSSVVRFVIRTGGVLLSVILCSLAVQIATFPLVLSIFGRIPSFFLLNLIWLPVLGFWVLPMAFLGLGCVVCGLDALASPILACSAEPSRMLIGVLEWLQSAGWLSELYLPRPHWTGMVGWACLVTAAAALPYRQGIPRYVRKLALIGVVLCAYGPLSWGLHGVFGGTEVRVLDVGQGQSVLFELLGNRRVLVDAGGVLSDRFDTGRDVVAPVLAFNAPMHIDMVAVTHADMDHVGGLPFLLRHFSVGGLVIPADVPDDASRAYRECLDIAVRRGIPVRRAKAGDRLEFGSGFAFEFLAPLMGVPKKRNNGLVLRLVKDGHGLVLLPGDAGGGLLRKLARGRASVRADVYVAAHHGSAGSVSMPVMKAVSPKVVLASCGVGNRFGFPSAKLRNACGKMGVPLRTTARLGELRYRF